MVPTVERGERVVLRFIVVARRRLAGCRRVGDLKRVVRVRDREIEEVVFERQCVAHELIRAARLIVDRCLLRRIEPRA